MEINSGSIESCLKVWREKILHSKRKELSPSELCTYFQNPDLQHAFFRILDRDGNGSISMEEWTGCYSKLVGESTDNQLLNWFVDKFNQFNLDGEEIFLNEQEFAIIVSDVEFGYRFANLISPKSRRINTLHLLTSLEIIASMSTDAKWLSWLKYQFTDAMKKSGRMDSNELHVTMQDFQQNFHFKEPFLAQRLFAYMDKDKSGTVSLHEFINGLEVVVNGTQEEKIMFLFKVFDVDGDGNIDFDEMRMMLKCCLEETPSMDKEEAIDDLTAVLFKECDADDSGSINFEELRSALKRNEALFKALSVSTSIWIKPKFINKQKKTHIKRIKDTIVNNRSTFIFWSAYIAISLACICTAYDNYHNKAPWLIVARIFGNLLNFNCALILVLVLRKHFTWIREKGGCSVLPIDDFIEIHKIIGIIILIQTMIHTVAHVFNLYFECIRLEANYLTSMFTWNLSIGYPTGVIELVLLFIILLFAMPYVRNRGHFQLFYWFHMLTIPWLLIMLLHGKVFYKWLIAPAGCYIIEKVLRYRKIRSNKFGDTLITEAYVLPSKVVHLVIRKPQKFRFQPGDYIFVNIPIIAKYEWHPFSISSAPEKSDFIWLHIKAIGNWTKKLHSYASSPKFDMNNSFMQRSLTRINMRCHMSKALQNESYASTAPKSQNKNMLTIGQECALNFCAGAKKTVSFERNDQIRLYPGSHLTTEMHHQPQLHSQEALNNEETNGQNKPQNKGILKVMMMENNGDSISSVDHLGEEFPNESTPKTGENDNSQENAETENKNENEKSYENLFVSNAKKSIKEQKDGENEQKGDENINTEKLNAENVITIKPDSNINNMFNLADEYFESKENKLEKPIVVINLEKDDLNNEKKQPFDEPDMVIFKPKFDYKNDVLGYMKMYNRTSRVNAETVGLDQMWRLKVSIDGPYGTPSQHIFDAEHAVLIASGIGITPFASILQSLMQRYRRAKAICPHCNSKLCEDLLASNDAMYVKKVDFIWITREQRSLEWFISILSQMEIEQKKNGDPLFLETHLYVTSAKRQSDLRTIGLHITLDAILSQEESNLVEGLKQRTHYGRPNWDIVMQSLIRKQKGKITVFYCGLMSLANVLQEKCSEYGLAFKKEIF